MNFLLTETRATHLEFCCISQFALRSHRTSWHYQKPTHLRWLSYVSRWINNAMNFLLTETRATHLEFCCISQFALRSHRTSWHYQKPTHLRWLSYVSRWINNAMNFLLTETRATHLEFCCISQFALRSRRTSWHYQTPTLEYIQIDEKEEFLLKVKCRPLNKHCSVFCPKNSTFLWDLCMPNQICETFSEIILYEKKNIYISHWNVSGN